MDDDRWTASWGPSKDGLIEISLKHGLGSKIVVGKISVTSMTTQYQATQRLREEGYLPERVTPAHIGHVPL